MSGRGWSVGSIHWAGGEPAIEWSGYVEGAIHTGERAPAEVLAARETAE
ncbi:hypothetical protein OH799_30485 [Nocardia sp. NBC_00881]|nr:hypothetical protein OH799_30485 [Nocardia sp. NBC_00881]